MHKLVHRKILLPVAFLAICLPFAARAQGDSERPAEPQPCIIPLEQPLSESEGGVFAHDVDGDGAMELVLTSEKHLGIYETDGRCLWTIEDNIKFFDSAHHPSVIAGDLDGDGNQEIAYLTHENTIRVLDGNNGELDWELKGIGKPRAIMVANFGGLGDREILLQYSQKRIRAIQAVGGEMLWESDEYRGIEHSPARLADLDNDGRDEIAGAVIVDHDGTRLNEWDLGGAYRNMDSMVIGDIVPGGSLEVALAEQRGAQSHTDVVTPESIVFRALNPWNWEDPDKLAIGDFDPERSGLEIYNRSSGGDGVAPRGKEEPWVNEQGPWVLDSKGELIAKYYVNDFKPNWWTGHGLEEISRIDWDGDDRDEIAGKERHKAGACAIVNPITGEFMRIFRTRALRLYVADILGDFREEMIVVDEDRTIKIFSNPGNTPKKSKRRYWNRSEYRRQKQNWNYYSP